MIKIYSISIYLDGDEKEDSSTPTPIKETNNINSKHFIDEEEDKKQKKKPKLKKHHSQQQQYDQITLNYDQERYQISYYDINNLEDTDVCNDGKLSQSPTEQNVCQGQTCYLDSIECGGVVINVTKNTNMDHPTNYYYDNCIVKSIKCPTSPQPIKIFDFKEFYGYKKCVIKNMTCKNDNKLDHCVVTNVLCDGNTLFGSETFGYKCTRDQLVCDGKVVPRNQFKQMQPQIANGQCQVQRIACQSPNDECMDLKIKCNDTVNNKDCTLNIIQDQPCKNLCQQKINTFKCICPADFDGTLCEDYKDFSCQLDFVSPKPACTGIDFILTDTDCFPYYLKNQSLIGAKLICQFDTTPPPPTDGYKFNYWIDNPNFKISKPVTWTFSSEIINFNHLFDQSQLKNQDLEKTQISGQELVWVNTTLIDVPPEYWIAKRIYFEINLETHISKSLISRYFVNANDYPDNQETSQKFADWKIAIIVIFSVIGVIW
eukprot:gene1144-1451_t